MKTVWKIFLTLFVFISLYLTLASGAYAAANLTFSPTSQDAIKDQNFNINIDIDTNDAEIFGTDVILTYPPEVQVVSVTNGGFFDDFSFANDDTGRLEIHALFSSLFQTKSGEGTVATVTLKSSSPNGSGNIYFACSGGNSDTIVLDAEGENILSCSSLSPASLTYTSESIGGEEEKQEDNTTTPTPTPAPTTKPTKKPKTQTTPTPQTVTLTDPTPTQTPLASPGVEEQQDEKSQSIFQNQIVVGSAVLLIVMLITYLLFKIIKRKNNPPPPTKPNITSGGVDPVLQNATQQSDNNQTPTNPQNTQEPGTNQ